MKILKFGAVWCNGCTVMRPRWEEIEKENPWLDTQYYDYDQEKEMVDKYNIGEDIPVFVFLNKEGNELTRLVGEISKEQILQTIDENKDK